MVDTISIIRSLRSWLFLTVVTLFSLWGCSWDEGFSTDSRYTLTFSADTVKVDTVFTGVASASEWFMVYNPNDVGLRVDAVMSGGEASPFRMNVDGQGGAQITGLEIPAGDSLFCFISVNIPETSAAAPFEAFDSIRFILENGNVQFVRLSAYGQNAVRLKGLRVEKDTVLQAVLPYIIFDSLYVAPGAVLTLAPGVRLHFHSGAGLDVAGRLVALGTQNSVIQMRGDRLDLLLEELPYDLTAGLWGGVRLREESYDNVFEYCDIHSGEFGIKADSAGADRLKFSLHSSVVHNVNGNCIEATGCRIDVANCQITDAGGTCVDIAGGESDFKFCTIAGFSLWSVGSQAVLLSDNRQGCEVPFTGAAFSNCIITGRHANEFITDLTDSIKNTDSYKVSNSLLMVSDTVDAHYLDVVFDSHERENGGIGNFRDRGFVGYRSVFLLDSMSLARGIADTLSKNWPVDLNGTPRPEQGADAGCYQYISQ